MRKERKMKLVFVVVVAGGGGDGWLFARIKKPRILTSSSDHVWKITLLSI
jgi:hypothetical protein